MPQTPSIRLHPTGFLADSATCLRTLTGTTSHKRYCRPDNLLPATTSRLSQLSNRKKVNRIRPANRRQASTSSKSSHNTLTSFLSHASSTNLSRTSTVFIGTHYEYTVRDSLHRFGFVLDRTGERGDRGVDLRGVWRLPGVSWDGRESGLSHTHRVGGDGSEGSERLDAQLGIREVSVLGQCKASARKVNPDVVREVGGVVAEASSFALASRSAEGEGDGDAELTVRPTFGLLACPQPATLGVREAIARSGESLVYVRVCTGLGSRVGGRGRVMQMLWNEAARRNGLEGLGVGMRYVQASSRREEDANDDRNAGKEDGGLLEEVVLKVGDGLWEWEGDDMIGFEKVRLVS